MNNFQLDARLAADTVFITACPLCEIRLMNDTRWPWLILVPRIEGAQEIHELPVNDQVQLARETSLVATTLKAHTTCTKINTGAIGNMVRQLHIHVIARNENDPNWPGPVWGYGERQVYEGAELKEIIRKIQKKLCVSTEFFN